MKVLLFMTSMLVLFSGCAVITPPAVKTTPTTKHISYIKDVKPILDKRCVSCHSCYNSPCQAKLSSFEGLDRGASKEAVYNSTRLQAMEPSRLFIDAQTTQEWRKKDFFSLTNTFDSNKSSNDSLMMLMLHEKKLHPKVVGSYKPEQDELSCPKNKKELGKYFEEKPNHSMPYGFPAIKDSEYTTLSQWLHQGAKGPSKKEQKALTTPSKQAQKEINKYESFFNKKDAKHQVTAKYLYEHLFLAHWYFKSAPNEFFEMVRSTTPSPLPIQIIPSLRPFDDSKVKVFYYRLRKIYTTIVHKTHMVMQFDDTKLQQFKDTFIKPKWTEEPHLISYNPKSASNPFIQFHQIPAKSRYQFLLENNHYIFMNFIRGPVCRGQMALGVIHDHFWVMFVDPEHDVTIQDSKFITSQVDNLSMPIETVSQNIFRTFSDKYRDKYRQYLQAKESLYATSYPYGQDINAIWKGEVASDSPLLTVYRHFDSASVHKGTVGGLPRTIWVVDYPQLEQIYYSLVAGYDIYGNIAHQTNIRRYADFLRYTGEINFISFMPQYYREKLLKSWYINSDFISKDNKIFKHRTQINYHTKYPKTEFIENVVNKHVLKSTNTHFDSINYSKEGSKVPQMPKEFHTKKDLQQGFKALTAPGTGFLKHVVNGGVNTMFIRILLKDGTSHVSSIVVNRWHDNVNSLFGEKNRLDSSKDTLDFIPFSVGSYPNSFAVVKEKDLPDFFRLIEHFDASDKDIKHFSKYFISRSDARFWETFDWFQSHFNKTDPIESGLYDLNRYYHK